ncbi:MAG: hypothetical protein MJY52_00645 [Bacteroidaceae bacterium]|nr:hypothetical protein [Bacteroidaceae bacterium]
MLNLRHYIEAFSHFHTAKVKERKAPQKAVMIMAIMELVESGHITTNVIHLDKELKDKFKEV